MKEIKKIIGFENLVIRNRIVRRVGLDSDVVITLVEDSDTFSIYKPQLFKRKNAVWINHIVFGEVIGVLINEYGYTKEKAFEKLRRFINDNNIRALAKNRIDFNKTNLIFESLKKQREVLKINVGDKDLMIISIYKSENMDCVVSVNSFHFEPFCKYLDMEFEKPIKDLDFMLKRVFLWGRRKKKKKRR